MTEERNKKRKAASKLPIREDAMPSPSIKSVLYTKIDVDSDEAPSTFPPWPCAFTKTITNQDLVCMVFLTLASNGTFGCDEVVCRWAHERLVTIR
jgi:hypothetical protein